MTRLCPTLCVPMDCSIKVSVCVPHASVEGGVGAPHKDQRALSFRT